MATVAVIVAGAVSGAALGASLDKQFGRLEKVWAARRRKAPRARRVPEVAEEEADEASEVASSAKPPPTQGSSAAPGCEHFEAGWMGFSMEEARAHTDERQSLVMQKTPLEVLAELQRGNVRFWTNRARRPEMSAFERRGLISKQFPSVAVLGCSDSRVPTEIVFDQGLGDLFVIRVAGNALDVSTMASVQYAVHHLKVKVLMVLGHELCGAVKAAMLPMDKIKQEPEELQQALTGIKAGLDEPMLNSIRDSRSLDREAVSSNVKQQVDRLTGDRGILAKIQQQDLIVVGAFYEISSGIVDFFHDVTGPGVLSSPAEAEAKVPTLSKPEPIPHVEMEKQFVQPPMATLPQEPARPVPASMAFQQPLSAPLAQEPEALVYADVAAFQQPLSAPLAQEPEAPVYADVAAFHQPLSAPLAQDPPMPSDEPALTAIVQPIADTVPAAAEQGFVAPSVMEMGAPALIQQDEETPMPPEPPAPQEASVDLESYALLEPTTPATGVLQSGSQEGSESLRSATARLGAFSSTYTDVPQAQPRRTARPQPVELASTSSASKASSSAPLKKSPRRSTGGTYVRPVRSNPSEVISPTASRTSSGLSNSVLSPSHGGVRSPTHGGTKSPTAGPRTVSPQSSSPQTYVRSPSGLVVSGAGPATVVRPANPIAPTQRVVGQQAQVVYSQRAPAAAPRRVVQTTMPPFRPA